MKNFLILEEKTDYFHILELFWVKINIFENVNEKLHV